VGKPNERERDLLFSFRKVHISSKTTFPAKENTSQHQICPTEICLVFHAKIVLLSCLFRTSFSMPTVHCMDCSVQPQKTTENLKITSKTVPKIVSIFVPNQYDCTDPYSTISHNRNFFGQKFIENFSRESCPLSSKNVLSLLLTFLSQAYLENLSNSPPDVLSRHSTYLAHYPMHSFII
jgi:hypothetical protein